MEKFWEGFDKVAKSKAEAANAEKHYVRRALLGTPMSGAIEAKKGKKLKTWWEGTKHSLKEYGKGAAGGGAAGALIGAGAGALKGGKKGVLQGAGLGAYLGGTAGGMAGSLKGNFDEKSSKIHGQYSKHK